MRLIETETQGRSGRPEHDWPRHPCYRRETPEPQPRECKMQPVVVQLQPIVQTIRSDQQHFLAASDREARADPVISLPEIAVQRTSTNLCHRAGAARRTRTRPRDSACCSYVVHLLQ